MSAAKNKKRAKGKTVALSDFLHDEKELAPGYKVTHVDWADAIENEESFDRQTGDRKVVLPTAPKSSREPIVDMNEVPTKPPFTAYVGNLPYDLTEEDIERFFRKMKLEVTSVRIPREGGDRGRIRGFGYAEFPDRMSLIEALALNNETLKNRSIKVSLATDHGNDTGERKEERSDRTAGDWRSASRPDNFQESGRDAEPYRGRSSNEYDSNRDWRSGDRDRGFGGDRDRGFGGDRDRGFGGDRDRGFGGDRDRGFGGDRDRGFGGDRDRGFGGDRDRGFGGDRDRGFGGDRDRGFGGDRDRGFGGDRDRGFGGDRDRGYGGDRDRGYGGDRDRGYGGDRDRGYGGDRDRGYGGDRDRGFGGDRDRGFRDRGSYERRDQGRSFGGPRSDDFQRRGPDDYPRRGGDDDGHAERADGPKERPKLQLKPRSVPVDTEGSESATSKIFGGAKPVDTAAREKEIEDKLSKDVKEPKPAERSSNIFGDAKPVDTTARERQIEEKLSREQGESKPLGVRNRDDNRMKGPSGDRSQESRNNNNKNSNSNDNSAPDRPREPPQVNTDKPVVYTSANKFSHLLNDEDYAADESSD